MAHTTLTGRREGGGGREGGREGVGEQRWREGHGAMEEKVTRGKVKIK